MAKEMAALGFSHIELSHGVRITLVPGILKAVEDGIVKVGSTHNFCPLPTGVVHAAPNLFEPSSGDVREHEQWVRHTKRSIDFAAQVKARVLVCHLGSVRFFWLNPGKRLRAYAALHPNAQLPEDEKYRKVLKKSTEKLRKKMGPFWERTKASVNEVLDYAKQKGVRLGFENREKFEELPMDEDFPTFLNELPADASCGYWHDTGHADIKEKMGVINHRLQLDLMKGRTLGFHLHDVNEEGDDHQPIGTGRIDFRMVREFWQPEQVLVLELSPRVAVDGVRASKERIEALLGS
jgi:Sugar phosphate isomerases/epimerases